MLEMHLPLLAATLIVFLVLLIALNKILYKPLLSFMANRDELIKKDLECASQNSGDADVYYEEANKIMLEAKNKASKERIELLAQAKADSEKKLKEKKGKLELEYNEFIKALETEKVELKNALNGQIRCLNILRFWRFLC